MDYNGLPAWYVMWSAIWGCIKHGTTWHLPKRKDPFFTTNPSPVGYKHCFLLDPLSFAVKDDLYVLDSTHFPLWLRSRGYPTRLEEGGGTEFYHHTDPVAIVKEFLASRGIRIVEELTTDPFPYPSVGSSKTQEGGTDKDLVEEDARIRVAKRTVLQARLDTAITKARFLSVYGYPAFRRIQEEVWDRWAEILATQRTYRGIVKWPTATGKTVAELIMILLCFDSVKQNGRIYRGLLIAPKNDILDTQIKAIRKLTEFGIEVIEAYNGRFSSTVLPVDKPYLLVVTHAALAMRTEDTSEDAVADFRVGLDRLEGITHVHYDEVHRATGERFFDALIRKLVEWGDPYVTGTSATPKTSDLAQHKKLASIFGEPFTLLHQCEVAEAVREGWIAPPRFFITQVEGAATAEQTVLAVVRQAAQLVERRIATGMFRGGKAIVYLDSLRAIKMAADIAFAEFPTGWRVYKATEDATATDHAFVDASADGTPRILFACDKYREGSDIGGLEFAVVLMGRTIAAYILLQIIGRSLRLDYAGKEGWCCIMRPRFEDETANDVFLHILLDLEAMITKTPGVPTKAVVEAFIRTYFGDVTLAGRSLDVAETVERAQDMYLRREYDARPAKEKYDAIRSLNRELGLASRDEYLSSRTEHPRFLEDPPLYFRDTWTSWYHFLGVDVSVFPSTKTEWVAACRTAGLLTWDAYKAASVATLPPNPGELYDDYTNWNREFGVADEIVW